MSDKNEGVVWSEMKKNGSLCQEREREKGRMKRREERVNAGKRVQRNKVLFSFGDQRNLINKRSTGNRESVLFCIPSAPFHLEFFFIHLATKDTSLLWSVLNI